MDVFAINFKTRHFGEGGALAVASTSAQAFQQLKAMGRLNGTPEEYILTSAVSISCATIDYPTLVYEDLQGVRLITGPKGEDGQQGPAGPRGPQGEKGRDGMSISLTVNNVIYEQEDGNINIGNVVRPTTLTEYRTASAQDTIDNSIKGRLSIIETKVPEWNAKADLDDIPAVVDNVTSTATDDALSAKQGKLLNDRINNISTRGRFLSFWDATTGMPLTNPSGYPYEYHTGDFFIVNKVGETNYIPNGATYTGQPSTTVYTGDLKPNDSIYYDGTTWSVFDTPAGSGEVQDVYQNGTSVVSNGIAYVLVPTTLAALNGDATHRVVTDVQIAAWNAKPTDVQLNGTTIVDDEGVANIETEDTDDVEIVTVITASSTNAQLPGAKSVYDLSLTKADKTPVITETAGETTYAIDANKITKLGQLASAVAITLNAGETGKAAIYDIIFSTGATAPTITWPNGIKWKGDVKKNSVTNLPEPDVQANKTYEISIMETLGYVSMFD